MRLFLQIGLRILTTETLHTKDFDFDLPQELIAQTPIEPRDASRLMVLNKQTGAVEHRHFYDIVEYLNPGDCLVLNNSRVLPARIYGIKKDTGAHVEFLLLKNCGDNVWEALAGPGKRAKVGAEFSFEGSAMTCEVMEVKPDGNRMIRFHCDGNFFAELDKIGQMPLPPYIKEKLRDKERYQTVYSKEEGSAAAPTAGLHFTPELLEKIRAKGVEIAFVTLHVGLGTFRPVSVDNIQEHKMHAEHYWMPKETADAINAAKKRGGRHDELPHDRISRGKMRGDPRGRRLDRHFYLPRLRIPRHRRADHEFSPAGKHADHARFRARRAGARAERLPHGRRGALPLLQLRRRDAHPVSAALHGFSEQKGIDTDRIPAMSILFFIGFAGPAPLTAEGP